MKKFVLSPVTSRIIYQYILVNIIILVLLLNVLGTKTVLKLRVISSVGSEHYLDRVGVTGSNPVSLTNKFLRPIILEFFTGSKILLL